MECRHCGGAGRFGVPCEGCIGGIASCCDGMVGGSTMRRRFVLRQDEAGRYRLVELDLAAPRRAPTGPVAAPMVIGDIEPYRSMRTGEIIGGRAQHRDHLRAYGLTEVGNEVVEPRREIGPAPGEVAADIKRELARDPGERRAIAERALHEAGYDGPQIDRVLKS
jgi:hypothetical protein